IQYYKSQPWSFSSSLLFGFWCKAHGDQPIQMDESELRVARWADRDEEINTLDNASLTSEMIQYFKQGKVV
ncbi:MAG: NADH pyrophosphatase, partial [Solobacterium sp.]|nr:NADH pyrophosphatase [Solobacterium sp.]